MLLFSVLDEYVSLFSIRELSRELAVAACRELERDVGHDAII